MLLQPDGPAVSDPEPDEDKLIAGRYRLIEQVGRGGMGTVWRGKDELLGRTVAVKQLTGHIGVSATLADEAVQRAMREARIAARLHHPNVIGIYDVVEQDDRPYLVMEFLASRSLSDILVEDSLLPVRDLARIGAQVAAALCAAHDAGIVHRDVKPGNVLLAEDGTVKLTDFGISRAVGDKTVTAVGALVGTVAYMAPEVGLGKAADARSDVYSLGATLYTAIEGEPPSGYDDNPIALLYRIVHEDITPPERAGALAPVLTWMLEREPARRLSMRQAQAVLEKIASTPDNTDVAPALVQFPAVQPPAAEPAEPAAPALSATPAAPAEAQAAEAEAEADAEAEPADTEPEKPADADEKAAALIAVADADAEAAPESAAAATPAPEKRPNPVAAALAGRRRQALIGGVAAAVVVLIIVIIVLTSSPGGSANAGATGVQASTSRSAAAKSPSPTPTHSPSSAAQAPDTSAPASPSASSSPSQSLDIADQLSSTITQYYQMVPNDLTDAWNWMTPSYQQYPAGGWSGYTQFWGNVQSVSATNVTASPPSTVTATITYHEKDGTVTSEVTRFGLVQVNGQWKINTSSVIG